MEESCILKTERLILREFEEKDLDNFMVYRNNSDWMKFQNFKNLNKSTFRSKLLIPLNFEKGSQLVISKKEDDSLIGDIYVMREGKNIYLGYAINPEYSKRGFTSEIVIATVAFLQETYPGCKIVAETVPSNIASIKLLEKVGFIKSDSNDSELIYVYK